MYIQVDYKTKNSFSEKIVEQKIEYNDVVVNIIQSNKHCTVRANGNQEEAIKVIRIIWELAFLYDGFFYKPIKYMLDGKEIQVEKLYFLTFYKTGRMWFNDSEPLYETVIDFSRNQLQAYYNFRNTNRDSGKLIKSLLNTFYYLHSEAYEYINIDHRLSLLLNICDGYVINTIGETNNVEANIKNVLGENLDVKLVKYGADLLGIPKNKLYNALALERNEIDHYICKNGSLTDYVFNRNDQKVDYIKRYFTYVIELALRIGFLKQIGYECPDERMIYAMNEINDWIILECELTAECKNPLNKKYQDMRRKGVTMR